MKPIRRLAAEAGGDINSRMASKTTLNWRSYFDSSRLSLRASSRLWPIMRAFVRLRDLIGLWAGFALRLRSQFVTLKP